MVILGMAVWGDIRQYKVDNRLILAGWIIAIVSAGIQGKVLESLLGMLLPVLAGWPFVHFKMMGGGDIKLFSVTGGFYGIGFLIYMMIAALFFGAVLSFIHIARQGNLIIRMQYLKYFILDYVKTKERKPYYDRQRDGTGGVIHFTAAIASGYLYTLYRLKGGM